MSWISLSESKSIGIKLVRPARDRLHIDDIDDIEWRLIKRDLCWLDSYWVAVVDAALSLAASDEEEAAEEEIAVDVAVLVAEAIVGVVEATDTAAVLEAEAVVDPSAVLEAVAAVFGRGEVVDAADLSATAA